MGLLAAVAGALVGAPPVVVVVCDAVPELPHAAVSTTTLARATPRNSRERRLTSKRERKRFMMRRLLESPAARTHGSITASGHTLRCGGTYRADIVMMPRQLKAQIRKTGSDSPND